MKTSDEIKADEETLPGCAVVFMFKIKQRVVIRPIGVEGVVDGFLHDGLGNQVRVCYWWDGERRQEFMYEDEVREIERGDRN